jgi:hypothetical protein
MNATSKADKRSNQPRSLSLSLFSLSILTHLWPMSMARRGIGGAITVSKKVD